MTISDEAAEAAARNLAACYGVVDFDGLGEPEREKWLDLISRVARNESCQKTQGCIKVEGHKSECTGAEVIPDEAVEAAAKRLAQFAGLDQWPLCAHQARAALEAAAPHLMAQALDEASEQLEYGNPIGDWLHDRAESYRSAGAG